MSIFFTSKLTNGGITKLTNALVSFVPINITKWEISSTAAIVLNPALTSTPAVVVATGTTAELSFDLLSADQVIIRIILDESMGPYDIGTLALYSDDDTLIVISTLSEVVPKQPNAVGVVGNRYTFSIPITFTNVGDAINFSIIGNLFASWPYVQTIADLPAADLAPFEGYIVREDPSQNRPITAIRNEYPANSGSFIWTFDYHNAVTADDNLESDTYVIDTSTKDHIWTTGSSEQMRLKSSNNRLGFGTNSPITKLHVSASSSGASALSPNGLFIDNNGDTEITIGSSATGFGSLVFADTGSQVVGAVQYSHLADSLLFSTSAIVQATLTSSGDFGIGATTPLGKLHVKSGASGAVSPNVDANDFVLESDGDVGLTFMSPLANYGIIRWANSVSSSQASMYYNHTSNEFLLTGNGNNLLYQDSLGNVGLGALAGTLPITNAKVTISQGASGLAGTINSGANGLFIDGTTHSGMTFGAPSATGSSNIFFGDTVSNVVGGIQYTHSNDLLALRAGNQQLVRINGTTGKVCIGDSSVPLAKLQIRAGESSVGTISSDADTLMVEGAGNTGITIATPNVNTGSLIFADPNASLAGYVSYNHFLGSLAFGTETVEAVSINNTQQLIVKTGTAASPGLAFNDGGSHVTGLFSPAEDIFCISTSSTERLRINSGGNVGIAVTTVPLSTLQIGTGSGVASLNGSANGFSIDGSGNVGMTFSSPNTAAGHIGFADPQNSLAGLIRYIHSTDTMDFSTGGTSRVSINSTGQLLIKAGSTLSPGLTFTSEVALDTGIGSFGDGNLFIVNNNQTSASFLQTHVHLPVGLKVGDGDIISDLYTGVFNSAGTVLLGLLSVTKNSDTQYTITHNLGTTNYTVQLTPNSQGGDDFWIDQRNSNTTVVRVTDSSGNNVAGGVGFDYTIKVLL